MLKYLAIFRAVHNGTLGLDPEQLGRVTCITNKSPVLDNEAQARKWIEVTRKSYPDKYYLVHHCVISFESSESENVEKMLSDLIKMF
ncbi:MAG: hypothetical protein IJ272_07740 [Clostridia bacterium]|nr:hypothetical protein [Clostridia bacterium]